MFAKTVDRLDEVFVKVEDLEGMRIFYRDVLGFDEEFYDAGWGAGFKMDGASLVLTAADIGASGVSLVFACGDIDRNLRAVAEAGLVVTHPLSECHWGAKVAGFEDPEGNTIYLEQPSGNASVIPALQ